MVIHGLRSFSINDWTPILESLVHIVLILIFSFILLRLSKKFTELVGRYLRSKTDEAEGLKRVETITRVMRYSFSVLVSWVYLSHQYWLQQGLLEWLLVLVHRI